MFPDDIKPSVFIASSARNVGVAELLRSRLSGFLHAQVWSDHTFFAGKSTLNTLHAQVRSHEFSVCIFGGSDVEPAISPNVAIELGMFLSVNGASRTFIVLIGEIDKRGLPSDLHGVTYVDATGPHLSLDEAVDRAYNKIRSAIGALWLSNSGIYGTGTAWHTSYWSWSLAPERRDIMKPIPPAEDVVYRFGGAIVFDTEDFVTIRTRFDMSVAGGLIAGRYFGRGWKRNGVAYLSYTGTDTATQSEHYGESICEFGISSIAGVFITKNMLFTEGGQLISGGYQLKRMPK